MEYNNFQEVIDLLHTNRLPYLVLRNYDNLLEKDMYMDGHGDVDMLVADSKVTKDIINAQTYTQHGEDGTHYYTVVDGKRVSLDLRHLGDGYYCTKWQKDMLERRVLHNGFYVMCPEDYFYSLIHHAILQKPRFSEEYQERLSRMATALGIVVPGHKTAKDYVALLEQYMRKNGYTYTYPKDIYVPLHKKYISRDLIEKNSSLAWQHWKFDTRCDLIVFAVKCKHLLTTGKFKY